MSPKCLLATSMLLLPLTARAETTLPAKTMNTATRARPAKTRAKERRVVTRLLVNANDIRAAVTTTGEPALAWLATTGGLVRLGKDGAGNWRGLSLFTHLDGLPAGPLHALLRERDGSLWVGGDGGLVRVSIERSRPVVRQRVTVSSVRALARFHDELVIGTWKGDVFALRDGRVSRALSLPLHHGRLPPVTSLAVAADGLYIGTAGRGLFRFRNERVTALSRRRLPDATVWTIASDGSRLWVGTRQGLAVIVGGRIRHTPQTRHANRLLVRDIRSILVERAGRLVVGTFGEGVFRVSARGTARLAEIPPCRAQVLARAGAGAPLLVGTSHGLLLARAGQIVQLQHPGPPSNNISALVRSSAGLWVGTFDRGLALYRVDEGTWEIIGSSTPIDPWINHLALQRLGSREVLWVATPRGVSRLDLRSGRWTHLRAGAEELAPGPVVGIHVAAKGVYFASAKGIAVLRSDGTWQRHTSEEGLPLRSITAVATDDEGQLWVGGLDGLALRHGGQWQHYRAASNALPDDWVTAIAAIPSLAPRSGGAQRGQIWVGTYDGGLAQIEVSSTRVLRLWRESDGLPCGWVNPQAMQRMAGRLWIGTLGRGLVTTKLGGSAASWRRFGLSTGLPSLDVTAIAPAAKEHDLWVGTRAGVALLSPSR